MTASAISGLDSIRRESLPAGHLRSRSASALNILVSHLTHRYATPEGEGLVRAG